MTQNTTFSVVGFAYDEKGNLLDCMVAEHSTEDAAIEQAKSIKSIEQVFGSHPDCDKIKRMKIEVEKRYHGGIFSLNGEIIWRGHIKRKDN